MSGPGGLVVGTAGHIDHGKTALVRALTGIDTDRLAEEKKRGISIDLGFAHLTLPNGRRIGFIDVPGHERFVKNMLAGVGGMQAVLLVVAADESVKPQTREHFDICRLLGIERGIIVLTKIDVASAEQLQTTREAVRILCAGSFLDGAPVVPVSSMRGDGLDRLRDELSRLAEGVSARDRNGIVRMPIDRSFALKGFGTVVTGTLWSGSIRAGEVARLERAKKHVRIRGIQVHGKQVGTAIAGQRTAINLAGVDHLAIRRGDVLTHSDALEATKLLDTVVDWLDVSEIPKARERFLFHTGTLETVAAVKVLGPLSEPAQTFARLRLAEPVLAIPGDRFVLRRLSPHRTVAGGSVIDAFPPARLKRASTVARLEMLRQADTRARVQILVQESGAGCGLAELVRATGATPEHVKALIVGNSQLVWFDAAQRALSKAWIERRRQKLQDWLAAFHQKNPSAAGAPIAQARLGLEPGVASAILANFPAIRVKGDLVSLTAHTARLSDPEAQALVRIESAFRQAGFQPPVVTEVLRSANTDAKTGRGLLETLIKSQKLVRVSEELIFHADAIAQIRKSLSARKGHKFSVPEFKDWTQISRKYAIPLLEYLDRQHVTRREGDARVVL
jgi:selenocysteine-specific elongation factor